jgi:phosphate transport system substrate-binding protein
LLTYGDNSALPHVILQPSGIVPKSRHLSHVRAFRKCGPALTRQTGAANSALLLIVLLALLALVGIGTLYLHPLQFAVSPSGEKSSAVPGSNAESPPLLRLVGSNTIGRAVAPALAKAYMEQRLGAAGVVVHPGPGWFGRNQIWIAGVLPGETKPRRIEVVAAGSGFAFTSLERGEADVGLSSRAITSEEQTRLAALGDMRGPKSEHVLGLDAIAVIVHPDNPVAALTVERVAQIFDGTIKNWREVGGLKLSIHRYARNRESGTYHSFREMVLNSSGDLARDARYVADSRELSDAVARDPSGIGFVGLPYIGKAKALDLTAPQTEFPAAPLTVPRKDHPLSRRLYLYTPAHPSHPRVMEFVDFALSPVGQSLVEEAGFIGRKAR